MFREHKNVVWGKECSCGKECSVLQNKFHPWFETDFVVTMKCNQCGSIYEIDQSAASQFYNNKIYSYFDNTDGIVLDLGCGSGFLTEHQLKIKEVGKVLALDNDEACSQALNPILDKINFIQGNMNDLSKIFETNSIDYIISRDVFMFVEDTEKFFDDVTRITRKGIKIMGWYLSGNERMKNKMHPDQIVEELKQRGWNASIQYLDWYKCGYFVEGSMNQV